MYALSGSVARRMAYGAAALASLIWAAVLSCTRARRHMLEGIFTEKPTIH